MAKAEAYHLIVVRVHVRADTCRYALVLQKLRCLAETKRLRALANEWHGAGGICMRGHRGFVVEDDDGRRGLVPLSRRSLRYVGESPMLV